MHRIRSFTRSSATRRRAPRLHSLLPDSVRLARFAAVATAAAMLAMPASAVAQRPLTLADALREARAANAALPVAALDTTIAQTRIDELRASRWPLLETQAGANFGGPPAYTTSQGQLQLVASDSLLTGGLRQASLQVARLQRTAAGAGFQIAARDVDLAVRSTFSATQAAEDEIALRTRGIARLQSYLGQIRARQAAGQPVAADILRTQVRLGSENALLVDAQQRLADAKLQLNSLLGRAPNAPLTLAPLPLPAPPSAPPTTGPAPWTGAPEVLQAQANRAAAEAAIGATRAGRKPQLAVSAAVGDLPLFAPTNYGTGPISGSGFGGSVTFSFSLPLWDGGAYSARLQRAQVIAQQSRAVENLVRQQTRVAWESAAARLTTLFNEVQMWQRNVPIARDAYLQTASTYAGGAATALEVLDAYTAWIGASESYTTAVLQYRLAEANYLRWGAP